MRQLARYWLVVIVVLHGFVYQIIVQTTDRWAGQYAIGVEQQLLLLARIKKAVSDYDMNVTSFSYCSQSHLIRCLEEQGQLYLVP